jgi:hypothetical protein
LQREGLGSRILQELPCLCRKLLHVMPDILTYYPAPLECDWHQASETEVALRKTASERVAKSITPSSDVNEDDSNIISIANKYQFSDDEIKMIMGRRYSDSSYPEALKNQGLIDFYRNNGFQELGDTRLLYAYTKI